MAHGSKVSANGEQQRALRTLLNFMIRESVALSTEIKVRIRDKLKIKYGKKMQFSNDDFANFVGGKAGKCFEEVREAIQETVQDSIKKFPEYIIPLIRYCFPDLTGLSVAGMTSLDAIFLQNASRDRRTRESVRRSYAGVYDVFRYSAHTNHKPDLKNSSGQIDAWDAWIVRAAMQIYEHEDNEDFPRFRMYYRSAGDKQFNRIFEINGIVVPIKNLVYFLGFDMDAGYPIMIVTILQQVVPIETFMGMVVRYREKISSSRVAFSRSKHKSLASAKDTVQIVKESDIRSDLEIFGDSLLNEVRYNGKAVLAI